MTWDESKNGWRATPPAVDCSFWCDSCGWNPEEQKRRLDQGEFVTDEQTGCRSLVFKNALWGGEDAVL